MYPAILLLLIGILVGLRLAAYNLADEEGRKRRLEARRIQRKARRRPIWHAKYEADNKRDK